MEVTIIIPFWGNHPAYREWLAKWLEHYATSGCTAKVLIASDEKLPADLAPEVEKLFVNTTEWNGLVNPKFPYDRKGAIVCATALALPQQALLVLDADAWLLADPLPLLAPYAHELIAMPEDEGAFGKPYLVPHADKVRRCAGVIFFGAIEGAVPVRRAIVEMYAKQFRALRTAIAFGYFHEERRLLEQHAWTFAAHEFSPAALLPRELNWPVCFRSAGHNPAAVIHHHIGKRKWVGQPAPMPGILNSAQMGSVEFAPSANSLKPNAYSVGTGGAE